MPLINIVFLAIVIGAFTCFGLTLGWASRRSAELEARRAPLANGRDIPVGHPVGA